MRHGLIDENFQQFDLPDGLLGGDARADRCWIFVTPRSQHPTPPPRAPRRVARMASTAVSGHLPSGCVLLLTAQQLDGGAVWPIDRTVGQDAVQELIELWALCEYRKVLRSLYRGLRPLMDFLIGRCAVSRAPSRTAMAFSHPS